MYGGGILAEHLATRKSAGLFDVSHMGRFIFRGSQALAFLQYALTNNAEALDAPEHGAQYTFIPTAAGTAVDDAYLYRFVDDEYLLVVNAGNREKDWHHFQDLLKTFGEVEMIDRSEDLAMMSLQGPASRALMVDVIDHGRLPEPSRNALGTVTIAGTEVLVARTGYTGEPLGVELFIPAASAERIWTLLVEKGATPVGLGARDTLRLEAALPLYGHELGLDPDGKEIPIFACPLARFGVSFSASKGEFAGQGVHAAVNETTRRRSICLAYLDSDILDEEPLTIHIRGKQVAAMALPYHMRSESPPYTRPIEYDHGRARKAVESGGWRADARRLMDMATANHRWRQRQCINLIPSEMTASPLVRLLSISDPAFRYAEHRKLKAYYDAEVFYYQGCDFIDAVETMLIAEMKRYFGCAEVETRVISGQMANTAVYSAMLDYLNRADRKSEPRRMRRVMNNHIGKGGHLSAQPMGALRDFVARDPGTERPAVVNFPVMADNPFRIDVPATLTLIDRYRPELIIFGKSMVISKEPVQAVREFLDAQEIDAVVMYDMAHVLGLVGPHFQDPFAEGADLVTGSTHKTFFGTQRGVIASRYEDADERYALWEAIERRTFPGSVSNHHLGTMVGLLMAAYEMNHFKDAYQSAVIANAKAFARSLADCGFQVAGDPSLGYTDTHQVLVDVGYARGPEIARRLEESNIICNYQAGPADESFSASGMLRMGVSEMTRFGMGKAGFEALAQLMRDVIVDGKDVKQAVTALRQDYLELGYCFDTADFEDQMGALMESLK